MSVTSAPASSTRHERRATIDAPSRAALRRARTRKTDARASRLCLARSTHRGCEGQGREGREGCEKGGSAREALEEALLPHLPQVRAFPSVASTGPCASATSGHPAKNHETRRLPSRSENPPPAADPGVRPPRTVSGPKRSRRPARLSPRVSVPPMCKLDQFQVRAARLPAGLRPLSARFRVSKGEDSTMKSARDGNDAVRRRRASDHTRDPLFSLEKLECRRSSLVADAFFPMMTSQNAPSRRRSSSTR